jgi:formate dehydrogenase maturation protein FdhE
MIPAKWDRRIRRANELVFAYPFAAEGLRFYSQIATVQKDVYTDFERALASSSSGSAETPLQDAFDIFALLPKFPGVLAAIERAAPAPLALAAADFSRRGPAAWQQAIEDFWQCRLEAAPGEGESKEELSGESSIGRPPEVLLTWIILQPYAEYLADRRGPVKVDGTPLTCPVCGSRPIVGVLRGQGDGAGKSMICMLCAHEWGFRRIYCPACGEEREPQMAFYSAPEIAHVRVDVCDTCHTYLKSIDLTKTGSAVPVVDELATIPLDLWAREHGYSKLQTNLLGL